jgi:hypothetical protein
VHWDALEENCVLQLHWRKDEPFSKLLGSNGFRVLTIARHPLDVLISILHFCPREPRTARWLDGECGGESGIIGRSPVSAEFLRYATSSRASALLSVSREWWNSPGTLDFRYEDLVARPLDTVDVLLSELGPSPAVPADVLQALTLENARQTSINGHYWQGKPGQWRSLLTGERVIAIREAQTAAFDTLGYRSDFDPRLTDTAALEFWSKL